MVHRIDRQIRGEALLAIGLLALPLLAYYPALQGGFVWDDGDYVRDNIALRSLDGLRRIWFDIGATIQYYPLTFTSFWVDYHLWGTHTLGYHVVNLLLHAATAMLVWRVLRLLEVRGAWLAAAIFAVHPVHVESVAWITERKNVLSGVFAMASTWAYLRCALAPKVSPVLIRAASPEPEQNRSDVASRRWHYVFALLCFAAALLSKTAPCPLPLALLLILWWKRGRVGANEILPLLPFLVLAGVMAATTAYVEKTTVGSADLPWTLTWPQRILLAPRSLCFYLAKLLWPLGVCFVHPRWEIDPGVASQYAYPIFILFLFSVLWRIRPGAGRGPVVGLAIFAALLLPVLGFVKFYYMSYSFVADHFQYLPSIPIIALVAAILAVVGVPRANAEAGVRSYAIPHGIRFFCAGMILTLLSVLTWRQAGAYRDLETLWQRTLELNPTGWMPLNNLGHLLLTQGRAVEAEPFFRRAIAHHPEHGSARLNLASILANRGETDEAIGQYEAGLRSEPQAHSGHNNLADLLIKKGRMEEAANHLRKALELKPDFALAHCNLGIALAALGLPQEAVDHLRESIRLDAKQAGAYYALAAAYVDLQRDEEAILKLREALRLKPDYPEAHHDLAVLMAGRGRTQEALEHFIAAIRLSPNDADSHFNFAKALQEMGRTSEAMREYQEVLRINPADEEARKAVESLRRATP